MTNVNVDELLSGAIEKVTVTPKVPAIPPNIVNNLLEFLRRVQCQGMEAVAWVEAYQFVQQQAPQQPQGIPFTGLPPSPPAKA